MNATKMTGWVLVLSLTGVACTPRHRFPEPSVENDLGKLRAELDVLAPFPTPAPASGSLWTDAGPGIALVRDTRAFRLNDLVTIVLDERDTGTNSANTALERESSVDFGVNFAMGLEDPDPQTGKFSLNNFLKGSSSNDFDGDGETTRSNALNASITARVLGVLPNGDLMIAGQKTVVINRERQVLSLVGSIRSVDIDPRNRVLSSDVGDLTVRLWGRGEVDATVQQGWFARAMNKIWPF